MDLDSLEVRPKYQYHVDLVPPHLNIKHNIKYHHQKEMEECLYLILLRMVVDQTIDLLQTEHYAQ